MRTVISVTLLLLVLSVFASARPLKQAKILRGDLRVDGRDDYDLPYHRHKPSVR